MFLDGFALGGYRSFGHETQKIAPLEKINLIIGQNNSGKSNILTFLFKHFTAVCHAFSGHGTSLLEFSDLDRHRGDSDEEFKFAIAMKQHGVIEKKLLTEIKPRQGSGGRVNQFVSTLFDSNLLKDKDDLLWFWFSANDFGQGYSLDPNFKSRLRNGLSQEFNNIDDMLRECASDLGGNHGNQNYNLDSILNNISPAILDQPKIYLIPAFRHITAHSIEQYDFSGEGIINELKKLQNPDHHEQENKKKFEDINSFLRVILENKSVSIEIPHTADKINVDMDNKVLPLESLGTGIHQAVMLAVAATILDNSVLCIEEPEIHIHPRLQRNLINYLREKTNNQYIIATHSTHFLDANPDCIFHIEFQNGHSVVTPVITNRDKFLLCEDLGYKASDIIQTNCIIWVEGPSDRIYINHWINIKNKALIEGVHYTIMFYGGKLLSHLSAEHDEIENFISLRSINRKMCIVMDSDKDKSTTRIRKTKRRLKKEFTDESGYVWVTKGREIENYIDPELIEKAVLDSYSKILKLDNKDPFSNVLKVQKPRSSDYYDIDKVKIAHKVTEQTLDLDILDLDKCVSELCEFIEKCNDKIHN